MGDLLIGGERLPGDHLLGGDLYGDPTRLRSGDRLLGENDRLRSYDLDLDLDLYLQCWTGLGGEFNLCVRGGEAGLKGGGATRWLKGGGGACGL